MSSYLQDLGDTQYSYRTGLFWFDEISTLSHGDVMVVRTFVGFVLRWKPKLYVGTLQKTILTI
jgi:hypothetical protein